MERYVFIARSVTYAQRMERLLRRIGITAHIFRAPISLTRGRGCAYALEIRSEDFSEAMRQFYGSDLRPVQIYRRDLTGYTEVTP